jgi:hypothetical protein
VSYRTTRGLRQYPPLTALVVALLISVLVLPSALNVPQANPTEVAEFAPVPPEDDSPPPPPQDGALSDLGLGTSDSFTVEVDPPPIASVQELGQEDGTGDRPVTKRCVGDPPRQTEDLNAPPCIAHWEGDNGGETWQGVTGDTITVIINESGSILTTGGSVGSEEAPSAGGYCDIDGRPPNRDEDEHNDFDNCFDQGAGLRDHSNIRVARNLSRFFNERFQTYGRQVHFWVYWSSGSATASSRRSDAHDNWEQHRPFAVIDNADFGGFNDQYADALSRRRVMVYSNVAPSMSASFFNERSPYIWSFWPDLERWVEPYVSYICQKVAPYPVMHSGEDNHGEPRKYAIMRYGGDEYDHLRRFGLMASERLKEGCPDGTRLDIVDEVTFSAHSYSIDSDPDTTLEARTNVASMMSNDATTILWLGGYEVKHTEQAGLVGWQPEWVLAGDFFGDNNTQARYQDQDTWRHAWMASSQLREDRDEEAPCRIAAREVNPRGTGQEHNQFCQLYRSMFMLFRGIQAAGPHLTPFTVDQGNRQFPRQPSDNPFTAACWFETGDYSCVKDMQESWWDPDAPDPAGSANPDNNGCWRMTHNGLRSIPWEWRGDGDDVFSPGDSCNNVRTGGVQIR